MGIGTVSQLNDQPLGSFQGCEGRFPVPARTSNAIIVDIGAVLFYIVTIPLSVDRFADKSILNAFIIGGVYLLFCASVFLLKRLDRDSESKAWRSG